MRGIGCNLLQQLEMMKYMRKFHVDDQSTILEKVLSLSLSLFLSRVSMNEKCHQNADLPHRLMPY